MKFSLFIFLIFYVYFINGQSQGPNFGSVTSNTVITGSSSATTNRTNVFVSDNLYASNTINLGSTGNFSDYLVVTGFGFSIPTNATITGFEVNIERSDINGKCKDNILSLIKGGALIGTNKALNPAWPTTDDVQLYGSSADLWGAAWTPADVNSSAFGLAFSWNRTGGGSGSAFAQIDLITIKVYYTQPLPVELIAFNTECLNGNVIIRWSTATQNNNDYFTLEKSSNGIDFRVFDSIDGDGNSLIQNNYSLKDDEPFEQLTYYRLKQTDFSGNYTYSQVIALECSLANFDVTIHPNPFNSQTVISFDKEQINTSIKITNSFGQEIKSIFIANSKQIAIEKGNIGPGIYFVQIFNKSQNIINKKVVIQ